MKNHLVLLLMPLLTDVYKGLEQEVMSQLNCGGFRGVHSLLSVDEHGRVRGIIHHRYPGVGLNATVRVRRPTEQLMGAAITIRKIPGTGVSCDEVTVSRVPRRVQEFSVRESLEAGARSAVAWS